MSHTYQRLRGQRFCLGVTGLSRSGKSTFITSLINQLLNHDTANLPGFAPVLTERLMGVKLHPPEDTDLKTFDYEESYRTIANAEPQWPDSTDDISGCSLELKLKLAQKSSKLNPFSNDHFSVFIDIRDYPGEWLLDLPLMDMSYSRWVAQCSAQYSREPRKQLLGPLLEKLQQLDPLETVSPDQLKQLCDEFKQFLMACKDNTNSLSLIQPGRFLIPGQIDDKELLMFIPLLRGASYTQGQLEKASKQSYYHLCKRRYEKYVKKLVKPFYKNFFKTIDRQLILVDVVNALNGGPEYIDDMRQALANISDSFSYGSQGAIMGLFRHKIDKVVFGATKVDQILSEDHDAVRQLLSLVVRQAYKSAQHEGVEPICEAIAAVRSSSEVRQNGDQALTGADTAGNPIGYVHPTIPNRLPNGEEWQPYLDWKIPAFNPPKGISAQNADAIPHIRLDTVLNALIGDKCK